MIVFYLLWGISFGQTPVHQKSYSFLRVMDAKDGLSENKIMHAAMDEDGLYWFATAGELNRWGGLSFQSFPMSDANGIAYSGIPYRMVPLSDHRFLIYLSGVDLSSYGIYQYQIGILHQISHDHFKSKKESPMAVLVDENQNSFLVSRTLDHDSVRVYYFHPDGYFKDLLSLPLRDSVRSYGSEVNRNQPYSVMGGYVWYLSNKSYIHRISPESGRIREYTYFLDQGKIKKWDPIKSAYFIISGSKQFYLVDGEMGFLFRYDCVTDQWSKLSKLPKDVSFHETDAKGNLAFANKNNFHNYITALFFYEEESGQMSEVIPVPTQYRGVISYDFLKHFFAYGYHGIAQYRVKESKVKNYLTHERIYGDKAKEGGLFPIRGIGESGDSMLLVSTSYQDIMSVNLNSGEEKEYPFVQGKNRIQISDDYSKMICDDEGGIWVDRNTRLIKAHIQDKTVKQYLKDIYDFVPAEKGAWYLIASLDHQQTNIYHWKEGNDRVDQLTSNRPEQKNRMSGTSVLFKDRQGILWIGQKDGVECFDPKTQKFKTLKIWDGKTGSQVSCIEQTADGLLWFGSLGNGLFGYDPQSGNLQSYSRSEGLPNMKIASIIADGINLWVASYDGLAYYFKNKNSFVKFYKEDGLSHNEFNRRSSLKLSDGRFVFGTINGINLFRSEDLLGGSMESPDRIKPVQISHFVGAELKRYRLDAEKIRKLVLPPSNRYCDFEFTLTGRSSDHPAQLSYRVDGVHKQWNYTYQNRIEMPWLPSGHHLLRVRGAGLMGDWSEEYTINLEVQQYFYQSTWFLTLISLIILLAIFKYQRLNYYRKLEQVNAVQFKQLHDMKSRFFSYITHEFRTPLTLILGYARFGEESHQGDGEHFNKIASAGERLLELVNQMLDLAKAESGHIQIRPRRGPLVQFISDCFIRIQPLADRKQIHFVFHSNCNEWYCLFDPDVLQKIIENLLTNAIKFTPEQGTVSLTLHVGNDHNKNSESLMFYELTVKDNGHGMSNAESQMIFEPFYQSDHNRLQSGSGLGLSLVRELTEKAGGQLSLISSPGAGSCFTIRFLSEGGTSLDEVRTEAPAIEYLSHAQSFEMREEKPESSVRQDNIVLIVEDNPEIAEYIEKCLQDHYQCIKAKDGQKGFELAHQLVPDLIVSDIMMPRMDGFQLLHKLKLDPVTCHVPVVLLTAKVQASDRIKGLSIGANAYLPKPFDPLELQLTLKNLFQLRRDWSRRYLQPLPLEEPNPTAHLAPDGLAPEEVKHNDLFYRKLCNWIEVRISETELDNESMCKEMGMSKSQLHRKVTALTGQPPVRLIRTLRLRHAEKLLKEQSDLSISEISYASGFNSPAYFARVFQTEKGMSPSEFREIMALKP
ncbi:MAG: response regulator [Saprospiraceae bacterium]|nr:response regulator [Saprospiraceae bacterium]HMW39420.1 ATP-binding protein [Saprospiraceae bacterium]HMX89502.1 ATP-binding protein [Saprospiraceae bacterium]HNA64058.1 ATP-binding protein [Saprospiraceae bacterium]HNB31045.1 ATP-binding protein [Saprospiraceae bacterium]